FAGECRRGEDDNADGALKQLGLDGLAEWSCVQAPHRAWCMAPLVAPDIRARPAQGGHEGAAEGVVLVAVADEDARSYHILPQSDPLAQRGSRKCPRCSARFH